MRVDRSNVTAGPLMICGLGAALLLTLFPGNGFSEGTVIPELIQIRRPAPQGGINEYINSPVLEGTHEGNIVYMVSNPAASQEVFDQVCVRGDGIPPVFEQGPLDYPKHEFWRIDRSGQDAPYPIGTRLHLSKSELDATLAPLMNRLGYRQFNTHVDGRCVIPDTLEITHQRLYDLPPYIFANNGMVYAFLHGFHVFQLGGFVDHSQGDIDQRIFSKGHFPVWVYDANFAGNGPILNNPGVTTCNFGEFVADDIFRSPAILSANRLFVPLVLHADKHIFINQELVYNQRCRSSAFRANAPLSLSHLTGGATALPMESLSFSITKSIHSYDPIPARALDAAFGGEELGFFMDPESGEQFGGMMRWPDFAQEYYVAKGGPTGAAVVWMGSNRPRPGQTIGVSNVNVFQTPIQTDLEPVYIAPQGTAPADQILAAAGILYDPGTAELIEAADRFVLITWRDNGVEQWGTFKYGIFGRVASPYGAVDSRIDLIARHVRDGVGLFFKIADLEYPFPIEQKKSEDVIIPVRSDGTFQYVGVPAGTYEVCQRIDGVPQQPCLNVNVSHYKPALFVASELTGIQGDQAYAGGASDAVVNISNGNLVSQFTDLVVTATTQILTQSAAEFILQDNGITPDPGSAQFIDAGGGVVVISWTEQGVRQESTFTDRYAEDVLRSAGFNRGCPPFS